MDFGSLDFDTWRLVGLGFLTLGALATVIAIVAIITMFRDGGTDDDRRYTRSQRDDDLQDDAADDDDGDGDVDEEVDDQAEDDEVLDDRDDDDREGRRTKVAAGSGERDSGPSSTSFGLATPQASLFTVPDSDSPRQPIRSTRDEPHVPSPDWYEYADVVDAEPVGDLDDDLVEALEAKRQAEQPAPPPAPRVSEQAVAPALPDSPRRSSPWFEATSSGEKADSSSGEKADSEPAPAVSPVKFPWEQTPAQASPTPERPAALQREAVQQPTAERGDTSATEAVPAATSRHSDDRTPTPERPAALQREEAQQPTAERADTSATEAVPAATSRHSEDRTPTPAPPSRQEAQQPPAERADTSATEAVPAAASHSSESRTRAPQLPVRQEPDSPTADWYDDPDGSGGERWWDGKGWTRHRRPRSGSPATTDTGRLRAARPQAAPPTSAGARRDTTAAGPADTQGGQSTSRPPGWYRDPSGSSDRRFWDGSRWTNGT